MTINEIAKKANVSRSTVSRALNNHPRVSAETRQAVLRVVQEMNYIPNAAARSLASKRSSVIGMLVYNITQPFWASVFSGVEQYISGQTDYGIFLANSKSHLEVRDHKDDYKRNLKNLVSRGVDGVIIALANDLRKDDIDFLESSGIPFVIIQNCLEDSRVVSVDVDNVEGAYKATRHLLSLGHKKIMHATGPLDSGIARERRHGYVKAMQEAGVVLYNNSVVDCGFLFGDGYWCMKRMLAEKTIPTALLCANDLSAFGAYFAAKEAGMRIPDDISIAGFDHLAGSMDVSGLLPDLTTMNHPVSEMGNTAAKLLVSQLGGSKAESVKFHMSLHEGATTRSLAGQ
ncbi:MAG: LacI family transcriptional regulator [Oscillospiraceae bacterium]|nr:LacI family transcriptional regulator [Oscillospiraceae bacterium]